MIFRSDYVEAVRPFIDQPLVKILPGVRRSGKSTIFEMIREELKQRGVGDDRILMKKYTEMNVPENITAKQMYDELTSAMTGEGRYYLMLDEIQEVPGCRLFFFDSENVRSTSSFMRGGWNIDHEGNQSTSRCSSELQALL